MKNSTRTEGALPFRLLFLILTVFALSSYRSAGCDAHFSHYPGTNPDSLHFYPTGGASTTYLWDFGNGDTSTAQYPWHYFTQPGTYYVCLRVSDSSCTNTWCDSVHVALPPICNAHFLHYTINNADSVHFYPTVTTSSHYHWDFGDGTISTLSIPWHNFSAPGIYTVCLTVTDSTSAGTCTDTWCDTASVGQHPICNAQFSHYAGSNPDSLHFYPVSTSANHYYWSFSDGFTSNLPTPWHYFTTPGNYYVCLTVSDSTSLGTCTATWCDSFHVAIPPVCNAHFLHYTINNADSAHFYPTTTSATHYHWDFGDGTTSTLSTPWHIFPTSGIYTVCLTVTISTSAGTCTDTWCDTASVGHPPVCNAQFSHYSLHNPDSLHFYPSSTSATHYYWSFSDGFTSNLPTPWHYFAAPGNYYVCLTVTDSTSGGTCSDTWCDSVHVGQPPVCDAHFSHYTIHNSDSLHFYPTGSAATHYYWSFSDGTTSNLQYPWHYFTSSGDYFVCLTVYDSTSSGTCSATWCDSVHVGTVPVCNAHFSHYTIHNPDSLHFYPSSTSATHYYWSFSDGFTSNLPTPWHYFAAPGNYYVCLTVTDSTSGGTCSDTWCDSVHIGQTTVCNAHFSHYTLNNPDSIHFYPTGTAGTHYYWSFSDGSTSNLQYPWHYFASSGVYYVCLTIYDSTSTGICSDTWCDSIHVGGMNMICNAHYTYYSTADSIHFISPANPTGTVYTWDFGDGNNSADPNPWYRYASPGIYSACLYVQDYSQNDSWCQPVEFSVFTSLATTSDELVFMLYPNPANTFVTIQMLNVSGTNEVDLFDVFGRKVYVEKEVRTGTTTIDTQELKNGLYICVIRNENKVLKQTRLIINH